MSLAIYIHWPFCRKKCPYCDFNSHVTDEVSYDQWQQSYLQEIDHFSHYLSSHTITSIYFGGGTPSLMPASIISAIIEKLASITPLADDCEITLEANPTSSEASKFMEFRQAGINRLSVGVQALNQDDLTFLGREHTPKEAKATIELAAKYFDRYSFDLIYARPKQTLDDWQEELTQALTLAGSHLSLYQLTIEKGTQFYQLYKNGAFTMPSQDRAADFLQLTYRLMAEHGFHAYEISNFAQPGFASQHNYSYWRYQDYLGIGPGAHSRITLNGNKTAMMMLHQPDNWLKSVQHHSHGIQNNQRLTSQEIMEEMILMGLRTSEGLNLSALSRHGKIEQQKLQQLITDKLAILENNHLILTLEKGRLLHQAVSHFFATAAFPKKQVD